MPVTNYSSLNYVNTLKFEEEAIQDKVDLERQFFHIQFMTFIFFIFIMKYIIFLDFHIICQGELNT